MKCWTQRLLPLGVRQKAWANSSLVANTVSCIETGKLPVLSNSFVAQGRCETCQGEGFVCVELLFMPSVYAPCSTCHGARYNAKTLEIRYRDKNIAEVLGMTVDSAAQF